MLRAFAVMIFVCALGFGQAQDFAQANVLAKSGKPAERIEAARQLATIPRRASLSLLVELFSDPDQGVRRAATRAFLPTYLATKGPLYEEFSNADDGERKEQLSREIDALEPYIPYVLMQDHLGAAIDAVADPTPATIQTTLLRLAAKLGSDDPPGEDTIRFTCGTGRDMSPLSTFNWLVARRPETAHSMLLDKKCRCRCLLLYSLGRAKYRAAMKDALSFLRSDNITFRYAGIQYFEEIGDSNAFDTILGLIHDPSVIVRYNVAFHLTAIDPKRAIAPLFQLLCDPAEVVRDEALRGLEQTELLEVSEGAAKGLDSRNQQLVISCCNLFQSRPYEGAIPGLIRLARGNDLKSKLAAIGALGEQPGVPAQSALIRALRDPSVDVRLAAIDALDDNDVPEVWEALIGALQDKDERVVESACGTLGSMRVQSAVASLRKLLSSRNKDIADAARSAVDTILGDG